MFLLLFGCASFGMQLSPVLTTVEPVPLGRRKGIQIDAWSVALVDGTLGTIDSRPPPDAGPPVQVTRFRFVVTGPAAPEGEIACLAQLRALVDEGGGNRIVTVEASALSCAGGTWNLDIRERRGAVSGGAHLSDLELPVRPVVLLANGGQSGGRIGWEIDGPGGTVAALERLNRGRTWIAAGTSPEVGAAVATTFAALLYWDDAVSRMLPAGPLP